jgi:crotonobetainyl-CoA:carnitine CoA-transferase CaiB-like acyl-CoA transferase
MLARRAPNLRKSDYETINGALRRLEVEAPTGRISIRMAKALTGINVLEFHSNLGAAYAAMLLAEQGADTIKVEPPGGALERGTPHFQVLNRSKRSVSIDATSADGQWSIAALVKSADLVITGSTPARLKAQGLDYAAIRKINPQALVLNVPPLGSRGPDAEFDASDTLVAARAGIAGSQWARSGNPVPLVFPAASYSAGVMGASAAVSALIAREHTGVGQEIEVSLLAGALSLQTGGVLKHEKMTTLYHGPQDPLGPIPCYRLFEASDHKYLFAACGNVTFWGKFVLAMDLPELVSDPRFENAPWGIATEHWQALKDILEPAFRTKPRDEWIKILREADVPCAPVMTRQEFIAYPQTAAIGMRREVRDHILGDTVQLGVPVTLAATPGEISSPAPTAPHAQRHETFHNPSHAPTPSADARLAKGPLDGITVLDFAGYIAGSYGPMILAQLGANVIKVESLEGDAFRSFGFGFLGWNQGKRGLAIDLNSREGLAIVYRLAEKADVLVENLRPGRMQRFGLDYNTLAKANPGLIYMSVNAFGNVGPDHDQPGFDPLLQARSGVMAAQGGPHHHPVYLTCAICDYGAAMLSAFGCILALRARQKTGLGQFCSTTLLQASMAFQAGEFIFYDGRPDMENGAPERRGSSALSRVYQCRDGEWLYLALDGPAQWRALGGIFTSMPKLDYGAAAAEPEDSKLASALAAEFQKLDRGDALARMASVKIPATPVNHFRDLFSDPQVAANELLAELSHSQWGKVRQTGMLMKFSMTPGHIERAAPLLGEHGAEVLRELLDYDTAAIASLQARGIMK